MVIAVREYVALNVSVDAMPPTLLPGVTLQTGAFVSKPPPANVTVQLDGEPVPAVIVKRSLFPVIVEPVPQLDKVGAVPL